MRNVSLKFWWNLTHKMYVDIIESHGIRRYIENKNKKRLGNQKSYNNY